MKPSPAVAFLLGLWIGASVLLFFVVGYSFGGMTESLELNRQLAEKVGFDPGDEAQLKTSVLWVHAGELNRAYFRYWNGAQLVLALTTLLTALLRCPRKGLLLCIVIAGVIALALTFYLAPQITSLGRDLDFKPRDPPPPGLETFESLHSFYLALELGKTALLLLAALFAIRGPGPRLVP